MTNSSSATSTNPHNKLRENSLGTFAIVFFVMSAAGPLVAMAGGVPIAMLLGNGPGIPALFALVSIVLCVFSFGYCKMTQQINSAGGFYALACHGLGKNLGAGTGLLALFSYNALQVGLYGLLGTAGQELFATIGIELPWWIFCFIAWAFIAFCGYRQVDLSAKILTILILAEYLVVLLLDLLIIGDSTGQVELSTAPFYAEIVSSGTPWIGFMLCFSAFLGFEATSLYSEEAKDPKKTIPRATYISVILIGGFYTFSSWSAVMGAGVNNTFNLLQTLPDPTFFMFHLSSHYGNDSLTLSMRILYFTSVFASLLAFHNAISRYFYALGRDKLLPIKLSKTHKEHQSPHVGSITQSVIAFFCLTLFALFDADPILTLFTLPSALATLGILVIMLISSLSVFVYFQRQGNISVVFSAVLSIIAFGSVCLFSLKNFDVLSGGQEILDIVLPLLLLMVFITGFSLRYIQLNRL